MTTRDVGVIIAAAGSGSRTGSSELKQFRWVAGKPMLLHSLQRFQERPDVAMVVCVLPHSYVADPPPWIFQCDTDRLLLCPGGKERAESVANGLEDIPRECGIILVHDAARPFFTDRMASDVIDAARAGACAVPVIRVSDTVKKLAEDLSVTGTVDRSHLWRVQTPQAFPRDFLFKAHSLPLAQRINSPDDAAICEGLGYKCVGVPGSERAIKITTESDFAVAEALSNLTG